MEPWSFLVDDDDICQEKHQKHQETSQFTTSKSKASSSMKTVSS